MPYKNTQIGWLVIAFIVPMIAFLVVLYVNQWGDNPIPFWPFILIASLLVIAVLLFYKLTVEIDANMLKLTYGIGIIKFNFRIDQLSSAEEIRTPWYYGLGIRITPKGMLYNIHGLTAVEIKYFKDGKEKSVMVGTDEPDKLLEALRANFKL